MNFFQDEVDIKQLKIIIENHVNHILQLQTELRINERKDYTPLSYSFIEECLSEIIML